MQAAYLANAATDFEVRNDLKYAYEVKLQCVALTQAFSRGATHHQYLKTLCRDLLLLTGHEIKNTSDLTPKITVQGDVFKITKEESKDGSFDQEENDLVTNIGEIVTKLDQVDAFKHFQSAFQNLSPESSQQIQALLQSDASLAHDFKACMQVLGVAEEHRRIVKVKRNK